MLSAVAVPGDPYSRSLASLKDEHHIGCRFYCVFLSSCSGTENPSHKSLMSSRVEPTLSTTPSEATMALMLLISRASRKALVFGWPSVHVEIQGIHHALDYVDLPSGTKTHGILKPT